MTLPDSHESRRPDAPTPQPTATPRVRTAGDILHALLAPSAPLGAAADGEAGIARMLAASQALASSPAERDAVVAALVAALRATAAGVEVVAAATTAAIPLATLLARRLDTPMVYLRPRPKVHGKQRQVEGTLADGARVLLVLDVVDDVARVREGIEVIARHGGRVTTCACLFAPDTTAERALADQSVGLIEAARLPAERPGAGAAGAAPRPAVQAGPLTPAQIAARMRDNARRVAETLLDIRAVSIDRAHPFTYVSGLRSPIYTDNRLLISHPDRWRTIIAAFVEVLTYQLGIENAQVLAGTATAGMPHATLIADRLHLPMVYVEAPGADRPGHIGGRVAAGQRAVMVEDHITTGKSVLQAATVLRDSGVLVDTCVSIFTYLQPRPDERTGVPYLDDLPGLRVYPLCDLRTLLDVAVGRGSIAAEDRQAVLDWLADPQGWSARHQPDAPPES